MTEQVDAPKDDTADESQTLLVVDDDDEVLDALQELLGAEGYRVLTAHDGEEALRWLNSETKIDLVITDLLMQRIDGWALIQRMGEHFPKIPILVISAVANGSRALPKSIIAMRKPVRPATLLTAVETTVTQALLRDLVATVEGMLSGANEYARMAGLLVLHE